MNQLHRWRDIEGANVVALCDRDPGQLAAAARAFGVERTCADAEAMLAAGGIDMPDGPGSP